MPLHSTDKKPALNRLDSEFEATCNVSDKEFAERFFALFVAPSALPAAQPCTSFEKTYPSRKCRFANDGCNKG